MKLAFILAVMHMIIKESYSGEEQNTMQTFCCSPKKVEIRTFVYADDYRKHEAPIPNSSDQDPMKVFIHFDVWEISDISLISQDLTVDIIFTVYWWDKRLSVNPNLTMSEPWIRLGDETFDIWRPTLLFRNCKGCKPLSLGTTVPIYVKKADAMLWAQTRVLTKFSCAINLRAYPMDMQNCPLLLYTNERGKDVLVLEHTNPDIRFIQPSGGLSISEFYIPHIEKRECEVKEASGSHVSCIEVNVPMERLLGYHSITSFAPTTFIVILSWISFWLPVDAVPARIALGLTSLLTLATRLDQAQRNLPPVSYVKAIDVWMFACISMVSISLLEFAVSYYRFRKYKSTRPSTKNNVVQVKSYPFLVNKKRSSSKRRSAKAKKLDQELDGTPVDRASRIAFPLFFVIFNIIYWTFYLTYY